MERWQDPELSEGERLAAWLWQFAGDVAFYIIACVVIGTIFATIYYLRH